MKKIFILILTSLFLISCSTLTGRTLGEHIDDATITSVINAKIIEDPELNYFKINVDTTKGHVLLSGFVGSKKAEDRLIEMIKTVRGVKSVTSHLKIETRK
ncbi:MAG: BON domain-containing protein [Thermodesulfovibrionales bacterium]|nr:BON domain-containing protein [Thermodesulfovibrionales bacterium]